MRDIREATIEYEDESGVRYVRSPRVVKPGVEVGDEIPVAFHPDRPELAELDVGFPWMQSCLPAFVALLSAVFAYVSGRMRTRQMTG